jgi:hypothetical protein
VGCVEGRIPKIIDMRFIGQLTEGPSPRRLLRSFGPECKLAIVAEYENAPELVSMVRDLTAANLDLRAARTGRVRQY